MIYRKRKVHSLPDLNNDKFKGYTDEEIRNKIEKDICEYFDMPIQNIRSGSSTRPNVFPRQIIMYLLVHYTRYNVVELSEYYNKKNHKAVFYSKGVIQSFLDQRVNSVEKRLINGFLSYYGYKVPKKPEQKEKAFVIDAHY